MENILGNIFKALVAIWTVAGFVVSGWYFGIFLVTVVGAAVIAFLIAHAGAVKKASLVAILTAMAKGEYPYEAGIKAGITTTAADLVA